MIEKGDVLAAKYRVERVLGGGGMGIVVSAWHLKLDQFVAVKLLSPAALDNPEHVERFRREAKAAARIKSEHVVRVLDLGDLPSGQPFIVMELLEGEDLASLIAREKRLSKAEAVGHVLEACDALAEAHALGIVHRDLKPGNLFLANRPDGSTMIKLLDFGISKLPAGELTDAQAFVGSPRYMSPEQLTSAKTVDARTDIWSLGIVLYELLGGSPPFEADSIPKLVSKILTASPPRLDAPAALVKIVERCLAKDRNDRFATVGDLVSALAEHGPADGKRLSLRINRLLNDKPPPTREEPPPIVRKRKRRRRAPVGIGVLAATLTLVGGLIVAATGQGSSPASSTNAAYGLAAGSVQTAAPAQPSPPKVPVIDVPSAAPLPSSIPPPAASSAPADDCNPPYWFDESDVKHYKQKCLER